MKITPPTTNPPSRKRTKIVITSLIIISIAGLTWLQAHNREPSYNGKPFTLWLEEFYQYQRQTGSLDPTKEQQEAISALGKMGTNAIPIIIRTLEKSDSPMRNKYREVWPNLPAFIKKILPKPEPEQFSTLKAQDMLSRLVGTNILGHLPALLQSRNPAVREVASDSFTWFRTSPHPLSNKQILSLCVPCLKDSASNTVPELTLALQGSDAGRPQKYSAVYSRAAIARALGSIGPAAASSVPVLTNLLPSADTYLRVQIASAVWHITSNEDISLPILISDYPALDSHAKWSAIRPLGEMGSQAKSALPMLLKELTNPKNDSFTRGELTNALKSIDPEAAAKAGVK